MGSLGNQEGTTKKKNSQTELNILFALAYIRNDTVKKSTADLLIFW